MNITYKQIIAFEPCYDPIEIGMPDDYSASITEFITNYRDKVINKEDILWVLCRYDFMPDRDLRLYAVWCARQVQHLMTDQRSIDALDVAERYAHGKATDEELNVARNGAYDAYAAAYDAAARATAYAVAYWDATASATAYDAAAAYAVATEAAHSAAVYNAARDKQIDKLLDYFQAVESGKVYDWSNLCSQASVPEAGRS